VLVYNFECPIIREEAGKKGWQKSPVSILLLKAKQYLQTTPRTNLTGLEANTCIQRPVGDNAHDKGEHFFGFFFFNY